jgi:uncharacterized protein (TIGR00369 family)
MLDVERSRTITWTDPSVALEHYGQLSGLEYLRRVRDGSIPPPPIASVFGMVFGRIEAGGFAVHCEPAEEFFNPLGTVHGGLACTMLDTALGCVAHTTLPAGVGYTSIDITVSYVRPILPTVGTLTATAAVVKPGRRVIFAEARLTDEAGVVYATATSSLLVLGPAR